MSVTWETMVSFSTLHLKMLTPVADAASFATSRTTETLRMMDHYGHAYIPWSTEQGL